MMDIVAAMRLYLLGEAAVTPLVGTRIYGPPGIPEDQTLQAMIRIDGPTGPGRGMYIPLNEPWVQLTCYGVTDLAAMQLYGVVSDALCRQGLKTFASVTAGKRAILYSAWELMAPFPGHDIDTNWPFVFGRWATIWYEHEYPI